MSLFTIAVNRKIREAGIAVRNKTHYEELYIKFRDEIFLSKYGLTFAQWKRIKPSFMRHVDELCERDKPTTGNRIVIGLAAPLWMPLVLIAACGTIALWCLQSRKV